MGDLARGRRPDSILGVDNFYDRGDTIAPSLSDDNSDSVDDTTTIDDG